MRRLMMSDAVVEKPNLSSSSDNSDSSSENNSVTNKQESRVTEGKSQFSVTR